jgi:hypothetical protein
MNDASTPVAPVARTQGVPREQRVLFLVVAAALAILVAFLLFPRPGIVGVPPPATPIAAPSAPVIPAETPSRRGWTFDDVARSDFAASIRESDYAFPALESIHLIGVALFFGSILMLDLRLLGLAPQLPIRRVGGLFLPLTWIGFAAQVASGTFLFIAYADQLVRTWSFPIKMGLIVVGGLNMLAFHWTTWWNVDKWDQERRTPVGAKIAAVLSIAVWVAAIAAGRWAGYERRPVLTEFRPPPAATSPGSAQAARSLYQYDFADGTSFHLSVTAGASPDDLIRLANDTCGSRDVCSVYIWDVYPDAAVYRLAYVRDRPKGIDRVAWDCDANPPAGQSNCTKR